VDQPLSYPRAVRVREVGPRDGLQSESTIIATEDKVRLIDALSATGLGYIEAVSFVSPRAVPQMADARAVSQTISRAPGVVYSALVPNRVGAEAAVECGMGGLQVFVATTDTYNLSNVRRTVSESMADVAAVAEVGRRADVPVEATISTAFGCPYEGDVPPERVLEVTQRIMDNGIGTVSYADTTGMATPRRVVEVIALLRDAAPDLVLNMHFHDTRGTGLANVLAALQLDVDYFDASVGGMGGSPFAPGATGNVATEDLVHMLGDMGVETGVELDALLRAARLAEQLVGADLPGKLLRVGPRWAVAARER
jgi:hydroxymethylglutaryl-CoA lyase